VSHGSHSKSYNFFLGSLVGHGMKFIPGKNHLGANVLNILCVVAKHVRECAHMHRSCIS
jgi:hypothetical protein